MVLLGVGEDGRSPVRERKTGGELEEETELVRNCSPGADLLQRRQQHGEDVQLTGGTPAVFVQEKNPCKIMIPLMVKTVMSPQILLKNSTLGNTVDETEGLIKRHEAFEKLLSSQEDKVCTPSVGWSFPLQLKQNAQLL